MKTLAALALALSTSLAHGAGFEIAPPVRGAARNAGSPSTASNGDGFLVVWREGSSAANGIALDRTGAPVTPEAFEVTTTGHEGDVAAFGPNYLLARHTPSGVLFSEVTPAGSLLRTFSSQASPVPTQFTASRDGRRIVVYNDVSIFVLDDNGRQLASLSIPPGTASDLTVVPSTGNDFLITAWRLGIPTVQKLTSSGTAGPVVGVDEPVSTQNQIAIVAAETGDGNILVVWSERANPVEVNVATISSAGTITRRITLPFFGYPYLEPVALVRMANDQFALIADIGKLAGERSDYLFLGVLRLNASGDLLDGGPTTVTTSTLLRQTESVAYNGETFHVVTTESLPTGSRVKGVSFRLDNGVRGLREDLLSISRPEQRDPKVAAGNESFLAVWRELSADADELRAARFTLGTAPVASAPLRVASSPVIGEHAVATSGREYLVVWQQGDAIRALRIDASGNAIDASSFVVRSGTVASPAVQWNGSQYLVVWSESGRIFGATVSTNGAVSAARDVTPRSAPGGEAGLAQTDPAIAWDGTKYLVVWTLDYGNGLRDVRGAIVSVELISPAVSDLSIANDMFDADIAAGDGEFLVVGRRTGGSVLTTVFLDSNGFRGLTFPLSGPVSSNGASVVWEGREFLVAYTPAASPESIRLTALTRAGEIRITRTESGVFLGAPDLAVNLRIDELALVASEVRSTAGSAATPRIVAFDEDRIDAREQGRRRAVRRQ